MFSSSEVLRGHMIDFSCSSTSTGSSRQGPHLWWGFLMSGSYRKTPAPDLDVRNPGAQLRHCMGHGTDVPIDCNPWFTRT